MTASFPNLDEPPATSEEGRRGGATEGRAERLDRGDEEQGARSCVGSGAISRRFDRDPSRWHTSKSRGQSKGHRSRNSALGEEGAVSGTSHQFDLALDVDADPGTYLEEVADALIDAGCDDATFSVRRGVPHAEFTRRGDDFADVVLSALDDVRAVAGVDVVRVEVEQLVTASEIARRLGRSRQSVQQLIAGTRGPGGFPEPADWVRGARLWSWSAVESWTTEALSTSTAPRPADMEFIAALNGAIQMRRHMNRLEEPARRDAVAAVLEFG
jgi:hypothetical protein